MTAGLQTFDASGRIVLDTTSRTGRVIGVTTITGTSGSHSDAGLATGTPFFFLATTSPAVAKAVTVTISGTTISWTIASDQASGSYPLVYGVY
ncbi:hypothetical protein [Martelella sp. HB161492]|uniref:hypothetical protein n=1 Tax=Martelella sp. HB161492 TaxID=2720726 RepID=UPI0015922B08|nr:hypothetical protein [Martelella sp. HB161492]